MVLHEGLVCIDIVVAVVLLNNSTWILLEALMVKMGMIMMIMMVMFLWKRQKNASCSITTRRHKHLKERDNINVIISDVQLSHS